MPVQELWSAACHAPYSVTLDHVFRDHLIRGQAAPVATVGTMPMFVERRGRTEKQSALGTLAACASGMEGRLLVHHIPLER
jgi:hypothetical protein